MTALQSRLLCLAAALLFSSGGAVIKGASLSGWQIASLRSAIAALTISSFLFARKVGSGAHEVIGTVALVTLIVIMVLLVYRTLLAIMRGEICVPE